MRKVLVAATILALGAPAFAQQAPKDQPQGDFEATGAICTNVNGQQTLDTIIAACTRLVGVKDLAKTEKSVGYVARGNAYLAKKNEPAALADYNYAVENDHTNAIALMMRGLFHFHHSKDMTQASRDLDAAIAQNDKLPPVWRTRGYLRMQKGDLPGAIADQTKVIALEAAKPGGYKDRGTLYLVKGDYAKALPDYDAAVSRSPKADGARAEVLNGACFARGVLGKELDRAKAECDEAIKIVGSQAPYLDSRALVSLKRGKAVEAWADWNAAVLQDQKTAGYLYGRGVAALKQGRKAEGEADIAKAKQLSAGVAAEYAGYGVAP